MGTEIRSQGDMTTGLPENWLQIEDFAQIESSDWVTLKQLTTQALRETWAFQVIESHSSGWPLYTKCHIGALLGKSLFQGEVAMVIVPF